MRIVHAEKLSEVKTFVPRPSRQSFTAGRAKDLRQEATPAEQVLWKALRNRRLLGVKFRRQHPIGRFVADFYCDAHRLVIELDGAVHQEVAQQERDRAREEILASVVGVTILRFSNEDALQRIDYVLQTISEFFDSRSDALTPPPPLSHGVGEGGVDTVVALSALVEDCSPTPPSPTPWERGGGGVRASLHGGEF